VEETILDFSMYIRIPFTEPVASLIPFSSKVIKEASNTLLLMLFNRLIMDIFPFALRPGMEVESKAIKVIFLFEASEFVIEEDTKVL
jgi:hypothetical protein